MFDSHRAQVRLKSQIEVNSLTQLRLKLDSHFTEVSSQSHESSETQNRLKSQVRVKHQVEFKSQIIVMSQARVKSRVEVRHYELDSVSGVRNDINLGESQIKVGQMSFKISRKYSIF